MSTGLLEIGLNGPLHIREEHLGKGSDPCRLIYVSDIHLRHRRSKNLCRQVLESTRLARADVILLGGDLVDSVTELENLSTLVHSLGEVAPVLAVGGNHDGHVGMDRVAKAVEQGGGRWIHDRVADVTHGSRVISVSGPDAMTGTHADDASPRQVRILCAHNPRIWRSARPLGYDLILAGHLHGCQVVAFEFGNRLFPGAIFYPYCYLSHQEAATRLVVSRGVSDLVPIRWRCPREVVLCYV